MDICEEAVLEYLTHEGKIFVCPQFRGEDFVPDFVALNLEVNPAQVEVIEVNGSNEPWSLLSKINWYRRNDQQVVRQIVNRLSGLKSSCLAEDMPLVIRVFIKREKTGEFRKRLNDNLVINSLDTVFEAHLDWRKRTLESEG